MNRPLPTAFVSFKSRGPVDVSKHEKGLSARVEAPCQEAPATPEDWKPRQLQARALGSKDSENGRELHTELQAASALEVRLATASGLQDKFRDPRNTACCPLRTATVLGPPTIQASQGASPKTQRLPLHKRTGARQPADAWLLSMWVCSASRLP